MDYKVSEDVAQATLDALEAEFGTVDAASAEEVYEALRRGLIDFDETTGTLTYHLQRPPESGSSSLDPTKIVLQEPDAEAMEKLGKAGSFEASKDGTITADGSIVIKQTEAMVVYVGGWPMALAKRIKRRDLKVLGAITNFFT